MIEILDICLRVICFVALIVVVGIFGQIIACAEISHRHRKWDKRREQWLKGKHDRMFPGDDKERGRLTQ